jgi:hypothetical protein
MVMTMNIDDFFPPPERDDGANAKRWRGPLFWKFKSPLHWLERWDDKTRYYSSLDPPRSVTFPICISCGHVIWDWPHFEEDVPKCRM